MKKTHPYLSIIIPAYNEEKTIDKIINKIKQIKYPYGYEIIVVDDASKDKTAIILKSIDNIKIITNKENRGKGYSLRQGFKVSKGEIILIQDADLEYDPLDHPKLLLPFNDKNINVVYGSRFLKKSISHRYTVFYWGNLFLSFITGILYGQKLTDIETCYKVFRKKVLSKINLNADRFEFDPEITSLFLKNQFKIIEVPVGYKSRSYKEGKKINALDGVKAILTLFKFKFFA